jgi:hypothetical protein
MGVRGVLKTWRLVAVLVVAMTGCGRSNGARPDATGTGGAGDGGIVGGSGAEITRAFTVSLNKQRGVDILFVVDDSSGMAAAQATLRQGFARFVTALRNLPDGLPDLHIAVVSSDMGAGDGSISGCSVGGKGGVFQYQPRGTCTSTGLQANNTFISDVGGVKNYTGNIEDVFGCIAALGDVGCGFEQPFAALTRALGTDGQAPPAENQGFLRVDAYLAIVLLTNEDDCSAGMSLFDTTANLTLDSQLGPPANFRCNEFGHLCDGAPPSRHAPTGKVTDTVSYQSCVSAESGLLMPVGDMAAHIKGLKADPNNRIFFTAITGAATPYQVHWKTPPINDTGPWPEITHVCTAANGSVADPGVRTNQLAALFGDKGSASSICDADFGPALEHLAAEIGAAMTGPCIGEPIADDPARAGYQPQCTAEMFIGNGQGSFTSQSLANCADNGGTAPCWSLATDAAGCQRPEITFAGALPTPAYAHYECAVCTAGVVGQGCADAGGRASLAPSPAFGTVCETGVAIGGGAGAVTVISSDAAECGSHVCLLPGAEKDPRGTGALCTVACNSNTDCVAGVIGDRNDPNDHRCKGGFVCATPTTVGDYCCQRMCTCADFITVPAGGFTTPPACTSGAASACANVR